jgi:hypothetical protein
MSAAWLAIVLAGPFVVLVLIGLFGGIQRSLRAAQQRERFRQEVAEQRRAGGLH